MTTEDFLSFDFGEFSLRSLGITINIPEGLGNLSPHIIAFLLAGDSSIEERLQHIDQLINETKDEKSLFTLLGYSTCYVHELKHFHDYLASPLGASVLAENMLAAIYIPPLILAIFDEPAIGVPIQAWQQLPDILYETYRSTTKNKQFNRLPPQSISELLDTISSILNRIKQWHGKLPKEPDGLLTSRNLIESAAVEVQSVNLAQLFGYDKLVGFCNYLRQVDADGVYTSLWSIWSNVSKALNSSEYAPSPTVRNAILFYALCGTTNANPEDEKAHPVSRFYSIIGYMLQCQKIPDEDSILKFLDSYAEHFHIASLEESLQESVKKSREFSEAIRLFCRQNEAAIGQKLYTDNIFDAFDSWTKAHEYMVCKILENPIDYFNPDNYIINIDKWVAAPNYLAISEPLFRQGDSFSERWLKHGWNPIWGIGEGIDDAMWSFMYGPELSSGHPIFSREMASELSVTFWILYLLCSRGMLSQVHRKVAALVLNQINPKWEILLL